LSPEKTKHSADFEDPTISKLNLEDPVDIEAKGVEDNQDRKMTEEEEHATPV